MKIALLYARRDLGGGSTSFTVHLYRALQLAGAQVQLYRLGKRTKLGQPGLLGAYQGVQATVLGPADALALVKAVPTLLTAPEHSKRLPFAPGLLPSLLAAGLRCVVHDPNEFAHQGRRKGAYDHLDGFSHAGLPTLPTRPICIRPTMRQFYANAVFIPHPYVREFTGAMWPAGGIGMKTGTRKPACTIARLTFVKRPKILLDANRLLRPTRQIQFHGAENRLTTFALRQQYPELTQGGYNLPLQWGVSARKAAEYTLAVDMTYFPNDGGGSQYTFMEAWDAGTVNVVHRDWLRYPGEMVDGGNCLTVESAEELRDVVNASQSSKKMKAVLQRIAMRSIDHLMEMHNPVTIAKRYMREMKR